MKTKVEIINETVSYYSEDINRRAYDPFEDACQYYYEGNMCAVGRCLITANEMPQGSLYGLERTGEIKLESLLKPEYRGHNLAFWANLQVLHDNSEHWTTKGLSKQGRVWVNYLLEIYND